MIMKRGLPNLHTRGNGADLLSYPGFVLPNDYRQINSGFCYRKKRVNVIWHNHKMVNGDSGEVLRNFVKRIICDLSEDGMLFRGSKKVFFPFRADRYEIGIFLCIVEISKSWVFPLRKSADLRVHRVGNILSYAPRAVCGGVMTPPYRW